MSQVTKEDIKKISRLARIRLSEEDAPHLAQQLSTIISWVSQLNEVNTDNVKILTNVHDSTLRMNKDEIKDGDIAKEVLQNAKNSMYDYFTTPKVIE